MASLEGVRHPSPAHLATWLKTQYSIHVFTFLYIHYIQCQHWGTTKMAVANKQQRGDAVCTPLRCLSERLMCLRSEKKIMIQKAHDLCGKVQGRLGAYLAARL
jgi:hypothetical protein